MNIPLQLAFDDLRTRITHHFWEMHPEATQERTDHAAYSLATAVVEARHRGREPAVQRAWDISLAQVGLTNEEARAILAKCLG